MEASSSFSSYNPPTSPLFFKPSTSKPSGLTLVLPALKGGKPIKTTAGGKKPKGKQGSISFYGGQDEEKKAAPRPVKLKPLKEVLMKLIVQIKKKDDYAFFLQPVDASQIPGYSDMIKRPMDFGTMTVKVAKGKYRSLEDFAADIRLVTGNAKLFNPPGTIYHTEAERIETWALDHVQKASATVIQYETDWNIDVEKDEEGSVNVDDEDDLVAGTPMDVDEPGPNGRSPSVASQMTQLWTGRRVTRGPQKKSEKPALPKHVSESVDEEGRLPGSREGLGAFAPMSDLSRTMVALKLKGKRYKKKERLRIEKEGPPMLADGSLDYTEMEEPFSVLSALATEPLSRPLLTPLYPPLFYVPPPPPPSSGEPSTSQTPIQAQPPSKQPPPYLTPTVLPLSYNPSIPSVSTPQTTSTTGKASVSQIPRKHWTVVRNPPRKGKDRDDEQEGDLPAWQNPREMHAVDQGSFALLTSALYTEMQRRGVTPYTQNIDEQEKALETIRDSVDVNRNTSGPSSVSSASTLSILQAATSSAQAETFNTIEDYWSDKQVVNAEAYMRDVVYGGADGYAYIRSLAEFCKSERQLEPCPGLDGLTLTQWVEREVVDPLTEGRHSYLREAAKALQNSIPKPDIADATTTPISIRDQVAKSLHIYPAAAVALAALLQIRTHKIDMGSLIKRPEELFLSEEEWAGKTLKEKKREVALKTTALAGVSPGDNNNMDTNTDTPQAKEVEEPPSSWMTTQPVTVNGNGASTGANGLYEPEGPEELKEVLEYVAELISKLSQEKVKVKQQDEIKPAVPVDAGSDTGLSATITEEEKNGDVTQVVEGEVSKEDPELRNLRLNLLALAKRAPLDTIARLPKDLVPEHIRQFIPTLNNTV